MSALHSFAAFIGKGNELTSAAYPKRVEACLEALAYRKIGGTVTHEDIYRFLEEDDVKDFIAAFAYFSGVIDHDEAAQADYVPVLNAICWAATEIAAAFDAYNDRLNAEEEAAEEAA